jgi:hypothetical protein
VIAKNLIADQGNYFPSFSIKLSNQRSEYQIENFEFWSGVKQLN